MSSKDLKTNNEFLEIHNLKSFASLYINRLITSDYEFQKLLESVLDQEIFKSEYLLFF